MARALLRHERCLGIEVRLDGTTAPTDFSRELVDIEIRHDDGRWTGISGESF